MYKKRSNHIRISIAICILVILSCGSKTAKLEGEYEMISYESKAWVDSIDFPIIRFYNNDHFEVLQHKKIRHTGTYVKIADTIFLKLENNNKLRAVFVDTTRSILRITRLVDINIEAKWGIFKKYK